jgi:hypothetical protein
MKPIPTIAGLLLLTWDAFAAVRTATGVSRDEVAAAYALCDPGDTLQIPAGTAVWTSGLTVSKAIVVKGAGIGQTIIKHGITSGSRRLLNFDASGTTYLTDIEFQGDTGTQDFNASIGLASTRSCVARCKFYLMPETIFYAAGYGVIYNCEFYLTGTGRIVLPQNGNAEGGSYGDKAWESPVRWGTEYFLFIEDCYATHTQVYGCLDGWMGGRVVFRHNTIEGTRISNHGTESSQRLRSMRAMEIYGNKIQNPLNKALYAYIDLRGGTALIFDNEITGRDLNDVVFSNYRLNPQGFIPFMRADGTKLWDTPDLTDGPSTPGGAGDGVFEGGTPTSIPANSKLADASKSWLPDEWVGYTLRVKYSNTATSGAYGTLTVTGADWTPNRWAGWEITQNSTNAKGYVASNTADTITLSSSVYRPTFAAGNGFVLSKGGLISGNTANEITTLVTTDGSAVTYIGTESYEIRKVDRVLDGIGRGQTTPIIGSPSNHQNLSQGTDPIYVWNNTDNGGPIEVTKGGNAGFSIVENRDYYLTAPVGYTPYTYPHPLRDEVAPDTTPPTLLTVTIHGANVTFVFNESVVNVSPADYAISIGTLSTAAGAGAVYTMTASPPAENGQSITINYIAGGTEDATGNNLASFTGFSVTNLTEAASVKNKGRLKGRGAKILSH